VGGSQVLVRTKRDDAGWIDFAMGQVVMPLDMVEFHRVGDAVRLIEVFQVAGQVRVIDDASDVALEVAVVHSIKPHQRDEQPPIGFNECRAE
jgi:hypothetical protein